MGSRPADGSDRSGKLKINGRLLRNLRNNFIRKDSKGGVSGLKEDDPQKTCELLTAEEAAQLLRVRRNTIYVWVSRREIPFVKLPGNTTRFRLSDIEAWLTKRASKGKSLSRGIYLEETHIRQAA